MTNSVRVNEHVYNLEQTFHKMVISLLLKVRVKHSQSYSPNSFRKLGKTEKEGTGCSVGSLPCDYNILVVRTQHLRSAYPTGFIRIFRIKPMTLTKLGHIENEATL